MIAFLLDTQEGYVLIGSGISAESAIRGCVNGSLAMAFGTAELAGDDEGGNRTDPLFISLPQHSLEQVLAQIEPAAVSLPQIRQVIMPSLRADHTCVPRIPSAATAAMAKTADGGCRGNLRTLFAEGNGTEAGASVLVYEDEYATAFALASGNGSEAAEGGVAAQAGEYRLADLQAVPANAWTLLSASLEQYSVMPGLGARSGTRKVSAPPC
jgi:hypothetical protein